MTSRSPRARIRPSPQGNGRERVCLLVIGAHRSGTSALARMLSLLGADLPATLLGGSASNAKGHWESEPLVAVNDKIFQSAGVNWRSPEAMPAQWYQSVRFEQYRSEARDLLASEFGNSPLFVLKDPRVCKLLPFWLSVLEEEEIRPAIVGMVRSPEEVAESLLKRDGLDRQLGMLTWLRYVLDGERDSRAQARVEISFDGLLADWQRGARAISDTFDLHWPSPSADRARRIDEFLSESDRHHRKAPALTTSDDVMAWAAETSAILHGWAERGESQSDHVRLDAIAARFEQALHPLLAPLLVSYEKSAAVQKLQALRSSQAGELEELKRQLGTLNRQLVDLASTAGLAVATNAGTGPSETEDGAGELRGLAIALKEQRDAAARELSDLREQYEKAAAEVSKLGEALQANAVEQSKLTVEHKAEISGLVAIHEAEKAELAGRLDRERMDVSARAEREAQEAASREHRLLDLAGSEREQRLILETRLAEAHKLNSTLLIVRGRFEAASEELARLKAERKAVEKRASEAEKSVVLAERKGARRTSEVEEELRLSRDIARARKATILELREDRDKLRAAVATIRDDRAARLEERDQRIKELTRSLKRLNQKRAKDAQAEPSEASRPAAATTRNRAGFSWRSLLTGRDTQILEALMLLRNSGLFDPIYYGERYADLSGSPDELLEHYVRTGGGEGRAPSAAFDSAKYLRKYPDVAASGLNPLVHFLRFGQAEGRTAIPVESTVKDIRQEAAESASATVAADPVRVASGDQDPGFEPVDGALGVADEADGAPAAPHDGPSDSTAVTTLPKSFTHLATGVSDWQRSSSMMRSAETVQVGGVAIAVSSVATTAGATSAISWFNVMNGQAPTEDLAAAAAAVRRAIGGDRVTIDDAWLSGDFDLRLRLSLKGSESLVVRCCQQDASGRIVLLGEKPLSAQSSCVVEIGLANRFGAILFVLTDREGGLVDSTLLPFATLVRGGLHHGELIDGGGAPTGWGGHESCATRLLEAFADRSTAFAVAEVAVVLDGANGTEPAFSKDFGQWLAGQFGVGLRGKLPAGCSNPALPILAEQMHTAGAGAARRSTGRTLIIGAAAIPSLNILLARDTDLAGASAVRTIIVDESSRRPLRGVDHPVIGGGQTLLLQAFEPPLEPGAVGSIKSPVVAISFRATEIRDVRAAFPTTGDLIPAIAGLEPVEEGPFSAVIDCSGDLGGLVQLLASLSRQHSVTAIECLLLGSVPDVPDPDLLPFDSLPPITLVRTGLGRLETLSHFRAVLLMATHDRILLGDDRKVLQDPRTIGVLAALSERDGHGTAGCLAVTETVDKNEVRRFAANAAYFGKIAQGRLERAARRPEDLGLSSLYPVLANPLDCMMTTRNLALLALSGLDDGEHDDPKAALALGRAMTRHGKLNVATSVVSVFSADPRPADDLVEQLDAGNMRPFVSLEEY